MNIEFKNPFGFHLEVLETDDHVPSLRVSVLITVAQFQHSCQYEGTFWIECAVWDRFVRALHTPSGQMASLHDMSDNFVLSVQRANEALNLTWVFAKDDIGGNRYMKMSFTSTIDEDILAKIRQQFDDFPVWW